MNENLILKTNQINQNSFKWHTESSILGKKSSVTRSSRNHFGDGTCCMYENGLLLNSLTDNLNGLNNI